MKNLLFKDALKVCTPEGREQIVETVWRLWCAGFGSDSTSVQFDLPTFKTMLTLGYYDVDFYFAFFQYSNGSIIVCIEFPESVVNQNLKP